MAERAKFLTDFEGRVLPAHVSNEWVLTRDLRWRDPLGNVVVVTRGTETDGASIPWYVKWLFPETRIIAAGALHDELYRRTRPGRRYADMVFYEALVSLEIPAWRAWLAWVALRAFGWAAYRRNGKANGE